MGNTADGADFMLYQQAPYVDDAGITFVMSEIPQWPNSNDPAQAPSLQLNYVNLWSSGQLYQGAPYATEAVISYTPNNLMSISYSPYTGNNQQTCPGYNTAGLPSSNSSGPSSTGSSSPSSFSSNSNSLSGGDIAAVVICTLIGAFLCLLCGVCCMYGYMSRGGGKAAKHEHNSINEGGGRGAGQYQSAMELSTTGQEESKRQTV